jgi:hypothetical protein
MLKIKILIFLFLSNLCFSQSKLNPFFFVGPMMHYNINAEKNKFSFSLEGSAWILNKNFPIPPSVDLGIEIERKKFRVYSELQTGSLLGLSFGPVIEFSDKDPNFGFQTSIWASFFAGIDFRYRRMNKINYYSPGMFVKIPISFNSSNLIF